MSSTPVPEKTRVCTGCERRKPIEKFEKDKRLPGGRTRRCRECATENQQGWRRDQSGAWKRRERVRIREAVAALRARRARVGKKSKKKVR